MKYVNMSLLSDNNKTFSKQLAYYFSLWAKLVINNRWFPGSAVNSIGFLAVLDNCNNL